MRQQQQLLPEVRSSIVVGLCAMPSRLYLFRIICVHVVRDIAHLEHNVYNARARVCVWLRRCATCMIKIESIVGSFFKVSARARRHEGMGCDFRIFHGSGDMFV